MNPDDIALAIEIRGIYDGTAVYLMRDGTLVNRFAGNPNWSARRVQAADDWIARHGDRIRRDNADLLDGQIANQKTDDMHAVLDRIIGRRVLAVDKDGSILILDDGTRLELWMSDWDCCASASGTWVIQPDRLDAIITGIRIIRTASNADSGYGDNSHESTATITILHNQNPVALAHCQANDGNGGYYCSTLQLDVCLPTGSEVASVEVVSCP